MKAHQHAIKAKSRGRVRAFVGHSVELISRRLVAQLQIDPAQANEIARDCAHDICAGHGGAFMYIPKDVEFDLTKRDLEIFERFNGQNLHELVEEFKVTHTRIYQIVARVKAEEIRKRQGGLFSGE